MECLILGACIGKCPFVLRLLTTVINPGGNRLSQRSFMAQRLPFYSAGGLVLYTECSRATVLFTGTKTMEIFLYSA